MTAASSLHPMVTAFAQRLSPVILSLGSSRKLWQDALLVPSHIVLYGNLPSKSFYSDGAMPVEAVQRLTQDLLANMRATGHPFMLGSECDVLFVPDSAQTIQAKVEAMMACARQPHICPPAAVLDTEPCSRHA